MPKYLTCECVAMLISAQVFFLEHIGIRKLPVEAASTENVGKLAENGDR